MWNLNLKRYKLTYKAERDSQTWKVNMVNKGEIGRDKLGGRD